MIATTLHKLYTPLVFELPNSFVYILARKMAPKQLIPWASTTIKIMVDPISMMKTLR